MGEMTPDEEQELRGLRARAYGPDADISGDERALRRLHDLESRRSITLSDAGSRDADAARGDSRGMVVGDRVLPAEQGGAGASGPDEAQDPSVRERTGIRGADVDDTAAPTSSARKPRPFLTRPVVWAWGGSLAVTAAGAAVAASVVTAAVAPPAPMVPGARHEATLSLDDSFSWPGMFEDGTGEFFTAYDGYVPISTTIFQEQACLMLYQADGIDPDSSTYRGNSYFGCGGGGFPPSVVVVDGATGAADGGRALQFVLNGSVVEVYSDAGGRPPAR